MMLLRRGVRRAAGGRWFSAMRGKTVVISGASSGIGEEIAKLYANQGADLFLGARRVEKLNNVKEECVRRGAGRVTTVSCDVSREGDCKKFIEQVVVGDEDNGGKGIDVLILNAGVGQTFYLEAMKEDVDYHQFMNINYYGCVYLTLAALPHLQQTSGRIAVVSSVGGLIPYPRQTFYNASKYALMGFYETLRMELNAKKNQSNNQSISITMACPGFIKTELTMGAGIGKDGKPFAKVPKSTEELDSAPPPRKGMMSAADCAQKIVSATDARKPLLITPGWYKPIYILRALFPRFMDKVISKFS